MNTLDLITLSSIQDYIYCPRSYGLKYLEHESQHHIRLMQGKLAHQKVEIANIQSYFSGRIERELPIYSRQFNLTGRADFVAFRQNHVIYPIECKKSKKKHNLSDNLQLMAQVFCLEEMFKTSITLGAIFYLDSKTYREVKCSSTLRKSCIEVIQAMQKIQSSSKIPKVPEHNDRCINCSLNFVCQPELLTNALTINSKHFYQQLFEFKG